MADEPKTDATEAKTGTQTTGAKTSTGTGTDKPEHVPYDRFEGVVAERNRVKEENAALQKQLSEIVNQHKTEDEKRIETAAAKIVEAQWKPIQERLHAIETSMKADLDSAIAQLPEAHRGAVDSSAPVEVQLRQVKAILAISGSKASAAIRSGASPVGTTDAKRRVSREEFQEWQNSAGNDLKLYYAKREEMQQARKEGRVDGLPSSAAGFG